MNRSDITGLPRAFGLIVRRQGAGMALLVALMLAMAPAAARSESGRAVTVAATDPVAGNGQTPGAAASGAPIVAPEKVTTSPVSRTVAFNSIDNPIPLTITGGAPTSVAVSTPPTNGTAVATGTAITYTPMAGYFGPDSFQYTATDADGPSSPATVTITVNPQPPIAGASAATVAQNSHNNPLPLNITGGAAVRLIPVSSANGTLAIAGTNVSYSPPQGFNGSAFFTYRAANAGGTSAPATVSITVTPLPPVAGAVSATVAYNSVNTPVTLNLTGGTAASVATPELPSHGTVAIAGTAITYTPTAGYFGSDSFTYTATNAGGTSSPATVTVTVNPQPPIAGASAVTVAQDSHNNPLPLNITGGAPVRIIPVSAANGMLAIAGTNVSFSPPQGFNGPASFTYRAANAGGTSAPATVSITVTPLPPVAGPATLTVPFESRDTPIALALSGGTAASVAVPTNGTHGTATPSGTTITYTPDAGFAGSDSFTYTATNTGGTSAPARVTVIVTPPPAPIAGGVSLTVAANSRSNHVALNLSGGPASRLATPDLPSNGTVSLAGTAITYSPTAGFSGADTFTYTATNPGGTSAPATVTVTVSQPTLTLSSLTATGNVTAAYSSTVAASLGTAPYSYAVTAGAQPTGLTLSPGGVLSGTATAAGTFNFTVTATDTYGATGSQAYGITISAPPVTITSPAGALPSVEAYGAYSQTFTASGGLGPHTFALTAGALPPGLSLSSAGALSGAPTAVGTFTFTVTATDSSGAPGPFTSTPVAYSLTVTAPAIGLSPIAGPLADATTAVAYSQTFTANGGTGPYSFAITAGALPPGIGLTIGGVLAGAPTAAGSFNFTLTATDANGVSTSGVYAVTVSAPAITVTSPAAGALPSVEAYGAYSQTFTASGGLGPHTFALTAGALPPGMSLSNAGLLSGAPTAAGTFTFTVTATDSSAANGPYASAPVAYSLTVTAPAIGLSPTAGPLPAATTAVAYSQTFTASGGAGPYRYSLIAGALPPGTGLSDAGVLSGTPTAAGTYVFTVDGADSHGFSTANAYAITVSAPAITVTSPAAGALPSVEAFSAYSRTFTATGGVGPRTFAVTAGALPSGLSFSSAGALSGAPTAVGTFNFTVTASDSSAAPGPYASAPVAYSLTVTAPSVVLSPAAGALTPRTTALAFTETFSASGGTGPYSFAVTAGGLPPGISLTSDGVLAGAPTAAGSFNFTLTATDANGFTASGAYALTVSDPAITVTAPAAGALPGGTAYAAYSQTFTAAGGTGPRTFAVVAGALPAGLALSGGGVLSGTPTTSGTFNFTLVATDSSGALGPFSSAPAAFSLTIAAPTVTITSPPAGPLTAGTATVAYSQTFTAAGGNGSHSFAVTAGALPPGLSLSSTGVLSGTPTVDGAYAFSIVASDTSTAPGPYASAPAAYSLTVSAPTVAFTPTTIPNGTTGVAYSQTFTATGGTAPYSYALTAGALPAGIALSAGGVLSGAPTTAGTFSFTVTATDANGFAAANAYSLTIADASPVSAADAASTPANQAVSVPVTANDTGVITSIAVLTAPANGMAVINGLEVTYTPTADYFGPDSFTYAATGPGGTSAPATVSLTVSPLAVPIAPARTLTVIAGQSGGVDAVAGATGGPITGVAIATAPANGSAVVSGQTLVYTPTAGFTGTDSFTYTLSNAFGTSAPATVTVTINPAPIAPAPITIEILSGQTATVSLTVAATGGPFTGATLVSLTPPAAGAAAITNPTSGQYGLTFTPTTTFAGTVTATYTLTNAFTTSAPGTVTIIVTARPDPSLDPQVTGLIAAQDETARRFASAQISNITSRLEALRDGRGGGASLQLSFSGGSRDLALDTDPLRRRLAGSNGFDTLLVSRQDGAAVIGDNAGSSGGGAPASSGSASGRVGLWAAGGVDFGQRDATIAQQGVEFDTDGLTAGVDVRVRDDLVVGASVGWGHDESRVGNDGTRSDADGHSYAVYGSYQPGARVFVDGVLGYGRLDLDSRRYVAATDGFADGHRDGSQWFGALTAGWDFRDGRRLFSPYGRLSATRSELDAFTETSGGPYALSYEAQTVETLTGALGVRWAWVAPVAFGEVVPRVRLEYGHDFQGADRADVSYADWLGGPTFGVRIDPLSENRILGGFGLDLFTSGGSRFGFDYEAGFSENAEQHRLRLQIQALF